MDFSDALSKIVAEFDSHGVRYALIGGLAIALRGVQRSTLDADFIILSEDLKVCDSILERIGYRLEFRSENVSHYLGGETSLKRLDFLHAFRQATLGMLERAERLSINNTSSIPVVHTEDLIGLKIQASVNDPDREMNDWSDIYRLIDHSARSSHQLDWDLIQDYLAAFRQDYKLQELKDRYGKIESR